MNIAQQIACVVTGIAFVAVLVALIKYWYAVR
jgi:hypothetical protein